MKPFKQILVPIDFSPVAREAIGVAADLAQRYEASLTLVHVYEPIAYSLPDGAVLLNAQQLSTLITEIDNLLLSAKRDAEAAGAKKVEVVQLQGFAATEICVLAETKAMDLIVMGTHGRTGLSHVMLGSVTERVLRKAVCPVLAVKGRPSA